MRSCAASLAAGVVAEYELPRRVHVLVPKVLGIGIVRKLVQLDADRREDPGAGLLALLLSWG